jgi:hypothetical protein
MTGQTWIEPPPPRQGGSGCFAKGCLILVVFCVLLGVAFVAGSFFAVRHLQQTFFTKEAVELPRNQSTEEEQQLALAHWRIFERSARAHQPARIEMTAEELNALIAVEPKLRGKAYVSIEGNTARLQISLPLGEGDTRWLKGYYVNGECSVRSASTGDPAEVRITNVTLNNHGVDDAALMWKHPWSVRRFISTWTEENDLKTFEIRDGKVFLETKGSG